MTRREGPRSFRSPAGSLGTETGVGAWTVRGEDREGTVVLGAEGGGMLLSAGGTRSGLHGSRGRPRAAFGQGGTVKGLAEMDPVRQAPPPGASLKRAECRRAAAMAAEAGRDHDGISSEAACSALSLWAAAAAAP